LLVLLTFLGAYAVAAALRPVEDAAPRGETHRGRSRPAAAHPGAADEIARLGSR
jgi:hypothetical protein